MSGSEQLDFRFCQVFGDTCPVEEASNCDIISAVKFDKTGQYLAVGDRGGRAIIFERAESKKKSKSHFVGYKFLIEFQSHEQEFDYLRSLEVDEKINAIHWWNPQNKAQLLLSANDKTIKLWKIFRRKVVEVGNLNIPKPEGRVLDMATARRIANPGDLRIPRLRTTELMLSAIRRRQYANIHSYHINSLSLSADGDVFLSADDLRIYIWSLHHHKEVFNVCDIKPACMGDLSEVITCAKFHPRDGAVMFYGSSKGAVRMCDMRCRALCDKPTKEYYTPPVGGGVSEIVASVGDFQVSTDGRNIYSRDYLGIKIWDVRKSDHPVTTIPIYNGLRSKLDSLYESEFLFDRFHLALGPHSRYLFTGFYSDHFFCYDGHGKYGFTAQASRSVLGRKVREKKAIELAKAAASNPLTGASINGKRVLDGGQYLGDFAPDLSYKKKISFLDVHPTENIVALATLCNLYIYTGVKPQVGSRSSRK
ncbi:Protein phosphatase PP2A regulatory subunit B [Aduncisulcus paluster]|uniref:Serine/threonine-protein phosphatase 2A 55 kDa regulatory subunit B n=1 Tax=Aduncisulcus paluster TaxID=2918883 RepID=A0ABQ5KTB4_9EUKA|nr:Protein phosphatase PP2A regulatory subunit B [Aduncisulcus paluster]|eukprot:gnl/Carplike_NY0171/1794_a2428_769.p1 GENE.gnl/Carplike_NY0171/1794_a2428_769~~gnl/Carplike_NY0171/1794_a2428_769.p1  ORF type:complete len:478 (+),score=88.06 gnl/Carplike_NY0171/1794_a2428_769:67-1500(+)